MTIGTLYVNGWIVGAAAVLLALVVYTLVVRAIYTLRRLRFVSALERFCAAHHLRLKWERGKTESLWEGFGAVDFVIDDRIHVAMISYLYRRVHMQLGEDRVTFTRKRVLLRPQRAGKYSGYLHMGETVTQDEGWAKLFLGECDAPEGDARVLLVYPMTYAVNDCRGNTARAIGVGDEVAGRFQFNNRTSFFDRLETYAQTGEMSVWTPNKHPRKYE